LKVVGTGLDGDGAEKVKRTKVNLGGPGLPRKKLMDL
jgi:hypothetical protein